MDRKILFVPLVLFAVGAITVFSFSDDIKDPPQVGGAMVNVIVPALSSTQREGETAFIENCASCHGENAAGQDGVAPPLIHKIYEPSHHGDASFVLAAKQGVRAHHWKFGNMPAVEGIADDEIASIIVYVRALQRANGIN